MTFSAEESVLLAALRTVTTGQLMPPLPSVAWHDVLVLAQGHKQTPALAYALRNHADRNRIPEQIWANINTITRQRRIRNAVMTEDFLTVTHALSQAGIPSLALKGVALANTVYPSVGLRYFDDLDLLVQPDSADAALVVLRQLGYIPHPRARSGDWHHRIPYTHPQRGTTIEIHTDVVRRFRPGWNSAELWQRATALSLQGQNICVLACEDALIHAALHARHTRFSRINAFTDAALLVKSGIDRAMLMSLSQDAGAANALDFLLRTAAALQLMPELPTVPTSRFQQRITGSIADWNTLTPHPASHQIGPIPKLIELLLVDSWRDSASLLRALLMPPQPFMRNTPQYGSLSKRNYIRRIAMRGHLAVQAALKNKSAGN
ncbi:MAG: nucleotidyltransferase family protein [Anaerolineae bacterium]|nr:nucleotidyltransferase family protein [Anaerolineae bacterium]